MTVHKWAEIRASRFSPEQIKAIQKMVDEELARLTSADGADQGEQAQPASVQPEVKSTLFGVIQADDITDEVIEEAKKDLFPDFDDL